MWERSGKICKGNDGKVLKPNAVVHIDANIMPEDILPQLGASMASKLKLLYTGQTPLCHPDENELIEEMLQDALKLHEYLPVLLGLAVDAILPKVVRSYTESEDMEDVLAKPGDLREGQLVFQYDNIFRACKEAISRFDLDAPPLFSCEGIDRTALVYFNNKCEVINHSNS